MKTANNGVIFKEQLKRFWPIILLTFIANFLFVIMPLYIHEGGTDAQLSARVMIDILSMRHPFLWLSSFLIPFGVVMALFSYLFKENAEAGFTSLAGKKGQLFCENVLAGIVMMIIPLIVLCAVLLIRVRFQAAAPGFAPLTYPPDLFGSALLHGDIINTFPVIAALFARLAVTFLFFFSMFLMIVTISGNIAITVTLSALLPFIPAMFHRIARIIPPIYVLGFDSPNAAAVGEMGVYTNPITWIAETVITSAAYIFNLPGAAAPVIGDVPVFSSPLFWFQTWGRENQGVFFLVFLVITLAFFVAAFMCFIRRRPERFGELIVFRPLKAVLIYLTAVFGMIAVGGYVIRLVSGRWFLYYGFFVGFVLAFIVAKMVFEKTFAVRKKLNWLLPSVGVTGALYGILLLITMFAMRPYTHDVPAVHSVAAVYVSVENRGDENSEFFTDEYTIWHVVRFHNTILDIHANLTRQEIRDMSRSDRNDIRSEQRQHTRDIRAANWQAISGEGRQFYDQGGVHLFITYRLHSGEYVYRRYALTGVLLWQLGQALGFADGDLSPW